MLLIAAAFAGVACTAATLAAVHEENEVVQLAQQLAASSAQVCQTSIVWCCLGGHALGCGCLLVLDQQTGPAWSRHLLGWSCNSQGTSSCCRAYVPQTSFLRRRRMGACAR